MFIDPVVPVASTRQAGAAVKKGMRSLSLWYVSWLTRQINQFAVATSRSLHIIEQRLASIDHQLALGHEARHADRCISRPERRGAWWSDAAVPRRAGCARARPPCRSRCRPVAGQRDPRRGATAPTASTRGAATVKVWRRISPTSPQVNSGGDLERGGRRTRCHRAYRVCWSRAPAGLAAGGPAGDPFGDPGDLVRPRGARRSGSGPWSTIAATNVASVTRSRRLPDIGPTMGPIGGLTSSWSPAGSPRRACGHATALRH